jgi:hypothetical protein
VTIRLPFTLTPLDGEPFEVWLHAYAARLSMRAGQLAGLLGLPARPHSGQVTPPPPRQLAAIGAATGLAHLDLAAMFTAGPVPSPPLLRAWMPQPLTRFCPSCLAEYPGQMPVSWCLPVTFFCLRHSQALASQCPHCGQKPAAGPPGPAPPRRHKPSLCAACGGCLGTASPPACADIPAARRAQEAINGFLAKVRDPANSAGVRWQALAGLTDLAVIGFHLATAGKQPGKHQLTPGLLDARTLTAAFTLLAGQDPGQLASLVTPAMPSTVPPAIPATWRKASPALRTRVARARDPWLRPADRLRHATTLATPHMPAPGTPGLPDPAVTRAARLPDQIWPDWAIRLTDTSAAPDARFRSSALIALLLPHSTMPLNQITTLVSGQLKRHVAGYQLSKLTDAALRILTELAVALDASDIPIDYQRRRDLATSTTLISIPAWNTITRDAGMRISHPGHARRYLYELLTGCNLHTAPPPYQLTGNKAHASYAKFTTGITTSLASALNDHAHHLLRAHGISSEPLEWQPPATWITATTWPGADPERTDPAPVHHALLRDSTPPVRIAADLGISLDHLRQVLHHHPLPRPRRPTRRTLIPQTTPANPPPGQQPGVLYLDPAWLREEYLTWHRSINDIATEIGCPVHILNRFAHDHGIPIRPRGTPVRIASAAAPGHHPRDLPEPLRHALTGRNARQSLLRLLTIARHASIHQAATALGLWPSILYTQIARLEHRCGGPLIQRSPRPADTGPLTPLGEQLRRQARDYIGISTGPSQQPPIITRRRNRQLPPT